MNLNPIYHMRSTPKEKKLLQLTGEMAKGKIRIIQLLSKYSNFFNQVIIYLLKCILSFRFLMLL